MARLSGSFIKGSKGSVGDLYIRTQNGKTVICTKPDSYTPSMEERPASIRAMNQLLFFISKNLMTDPFFYDLWKRNDIAGLGPYHKFNSNNHFGKKTELTVSDIHLTPYNEGFSAEAESISMAGEDIELIIKPLGEISGIDPLRTPYITSNGILFCRDYPGSKDLMAADNLKSEIKITDLLNPLSFKYKAKTTWSPEKYKEKWVMVVITVLNSEQNAVNTSITLSKIFL